MTKVKFIFDIEKDILNVWNTANFETPWMDFKKQVNPEILKMCKGKQFEECKEEIKFFYSKFYDSELAKMQIDMMQKMWDKISGEFFKRLEKITGKKMPFEEVTAYITTQKRCPYDPKEPSFMVSLFCPMLNALCTCGHELMHIHFHNTDWRMVEEQIGRNKTSDLKEALTVLLNLEFKDLWLMIDFGYVPHKELREFISKKWSEEKNFDKLLNSCIDFFNNGESIF